MITLDFRDISTPTRSKVVGRIRKCLILERKVLEDAIASYPADSKAGLEMRAWLHAVTAFYENTENMVVNVPEGLSSGACFRIAMELEPMARLQTSLRRESGMFLAQYQEHDVPMTREEEFDRDLLKFVHSMSRR